MQFPIVKEYKTDIEGTNLENAIDNEPFSVEAGLFSRVVVPRHAPFFVESLRLTTLTGEPLIFGKHWRIFQHMGRLSNLTAAPMACMIELLDPNITTGKFYYKTAGEFSVIDNALLQLIANAMNDDRPVYWEYLQGKPTVFPPTLHSHSILYDIVAFQDMIEFFGHLIDYVQNHQRDWIQLRVEHYYNLIKNYTQVFGDMLRSYLSNHENAYNAHGLTAAQVLLEKVDNFATATPAQALQPRKDMHLTPSGLKSIVETYGYTPGDYLENGVLPMSQFGNTNFIPPSIDGSFEGLGSKAETCAFALENDGSVVIVGNRLDGRNNGLYFSVLKDYTTNNPKQMYSAYRYNHQKFIQDGANVDMVVNGSNGEAMLVADSAKQLFYIGVTNGTMNPAKHVYSQIDLNPLLQAVYSDWQTRKMSDWLYTCSIAKIGDWVYIFFAHSRPNPTDTSEEVFYSLTYRHVFRVSFSGIKNLVKMTPQPVSLSFTDLDNNSWNNTNVWRWGTRVMLPGGSAGMTKKLLFNFEPYEDQHARINYSQCTLATPNPNKPGFFALKFLSYYYCGDVASGKYTYAFLEVCYEFNPDTNVMTKISQTTLPTINWADQYPRNNYLTGPWDILVTGDAKVGLVCLDDMRCLSSGCLKTGGFPWYTKILKPAGVINKYDFFTRVWQNTGYEVSVAPYEGVVPPTANNVAPRPPMTFPTAEVFLSNRGDNSDALGFYLRNITGKYAAQSNVSNLFISDLWSRRLTNDIRLLKAPTHLGGATVSVPSAQLDAYGIETALSSWCMAPQRRYADRNTMGDAWTPAVGLDDVLLIDTHTFRLDADGAATLVPGHEILYPATIVNQLKQQVENLASMQSSAKVWVTICDPNGQLTNRFGWLPVVVMITYAERANFSRRQTTLTITPTYSAQGARSVVTGFTVLDKTHFLFEGSASGQLNNGWADGWVTGNSEGPDVRYNRGAQHCYYYLNGNALDIWFDPAVQSGAYSNVVGMGISLRYDNRNTQRWTTAEWRSTQVNVPPYAVTPDNGITQTYAYEESTGGAGIIARKAGSGHNVLLASVYPEVGWVIFFQTAIQAVFRGKTFTIPNGLVDLRDIDSAPGNKTFYVYAVLRDGKAVYEVTTQKRLESDYQLWVATAVTNATQIVSVDRFNVLALDGHRISEVKRGNSIPASSGLVAEEGQIPWIYSRELLP
jgi:hypothetical protein